MAAQHFFLGTQYLGLRQIPDNRVYPGMDIVRHRSYVYFCHRCGDLWARILHEGSNWTQVIQTPCLEHGDGRLSEDWLPTAYLPVRYEVNWPAAATRYEFGAQLAYATKELSHAKK